MHKTFWALSLFFTYPVHFNVDYITWKTIQLLPHSLQFCPQLWIRIQSQNYLYVSIRIFHKHTKLAIWHKRLWWVTAKDFQQQKSHQRDLIQQSVTYQSIALSAQLLCHMVVVRIFKLILFMALFDLEDLTTISRPWLHKGFKGFRLTNISWIAHRKSSVLSNKRLLD